MFDFRIMLRIELARFTATSGMILVSMLLAALGAFLTTLSAFLAATLTFVLARAFGATLLAFGATRLGLLLLICLCCALCHGDRECGQEEREQHNENSALSGFHFCSPIQMMITVGHQRTHRHFRCETLAS
jgi:hypothetical protein